MLSSFPSYFKIALWAARPSLGEKSGGKESYHILASTLITQIVSSRLAIVA